MLFKPLDFEKTYLWFSPSQRLRANFELLWAIYPRPKREKHKMTQEFTSPTLQEFWSTHCQRLLSCFQSSQEVAPFAGWTKAPRCSRLCQNLAFQNWPGKERTPESQFSSPRTSWFRPSKHWKALPKLGWSPLAWDHQVHGMASSKTKKNGDSRTPVIAKLASLDVSKAIQQLARAASERV